jgi:hypothetical protein
MGTMAAILGSIGGLCAVMGIITIADVIQPTPLGEQYTWAFWLALSAILLLASIALAVGRSGGSPD